MSKSGVFAHFGSREELQIAVIREYHRRFEEEVFFPAMREPRGVPRLRALFERWMRRVSVEVDSGCIYISGAVEFDDRPGPVRDALVEHGARLARRAGARHPHRHRRRPAASADTDAAADAVRDARPDPRAAPRRALPAHARRAAARARWPSSASSTTTQPRRTRRAGRAQAVARTERHFPSSSRSLQPCPSTPRPLRDMQFVHARTAQCRRRAEDAAAPRRTSTPTPSTRCSRKAASSPPR